MRFILKILLSMMVTVLLSSILFAFVLTLFSLRGAPPRVLLALFVPADGFSRQQIAGFAVLGAAFALLFACVFFARRTFSGVSPEGLSPAEEDACPAAVPGYGSAVPVQKSGKSGRNPSAAGRYVWFAGSGKLRIPAALCWSISASFPAADCRGLPGNGRKRFLRLPPP